MPGDGSRSTSLYDSVTVRQRCAEDVAACAEMLAEVHRQDHYPCRWPADPVDWLSPFTLLIAWVAVAPGGHLVGHIALSGGVNDPLLVTATGRPTDELASVSRLFVDPSARGSRLGERLLRVATDFARERCRGLVLEVVGEPRSAAINLYERTGWRLVGHRSAGWVTADGIRPLLRVYALPADPTSM